MTEAELPVPESTLPSNLQLHLRGFAPDAEFTSRFAAALSEVLIECGRLFDLERLDGVTVGYDYADSLASVDLGFQSTRAREYTKTDRIVGVAKSMNVLREGRVMSHVVYDARFVEAIVEPEHEYHLQALHILAHELGHVAELKWRDEALPGFMLRPYPMGQGRAMLLESALAIWEEYAACRLTARLGDSQAQTALYVDNYVGHVGDAVSRAHAAVRAYRTHGDIVRLMVEAGGPVLEPLRLAGYLLGHLDGLGEDVDLDTLCPAHVGTPFETLSVALRDVLHAIWDGRDDWDGLETFDPVVEIVTRALSHAGLHCTPHDEDLYVDVPYTAETLPGGAAELAMIDLRRTLGLE